MKEGRNPITMILMGVGFVLLSVGGLLATLVGSLIASGPFGWIASGAGIVLGGAASWIFIGQIGATIISFAGYVLQFASVVFEILLSYTVIGFGATLSDYGILAGIKTVWTAFRDIANIIIVGMFVFVAIATILNNTNYGVKKFLVRILIVAVMINFSLLLTQIVIDLSHIAANQFYLGIRAAAASGPVNIQQQSGNRSLGDIWSQQGGVAGAFQYKMGISSSEDNAKLINEMSKTSFVAALLYILVTPILLFATAGVFLYGGYLLLARALIIIVLLVTSALAFATWLIPKYGEGKYGWSGWVEALIQSAVFAPLLMMFLWATLKILEGATPGSIGAVLTDAQSAWDGSRTIIIYLFTIGMLYLSINIANSFSQKITGFAMAQKGLGVAGRLAAGTFGFAAKQSVGQIAKGLRFSDVGAKLRQGRVWSDKITTPAATEKAIAKLGLKMFRTGHEASYNVARIPDAIKDKQEDLKKRYGFGTGGKGGLAADEKRATERSDAEKKKDKEEIAEAIKRAAPAPTDTESRRLFETELASRNQQYSLQQGVVARQEARASKAEALLKEIARREPLTTGTTEKARLANQKAKIETHMKAAAAKINEAKARIDKLGDYRKREDDSYKKATIGTQIEKQGAMIDRLAGAFEQAEARSILGGQREQRDLKKIVDALKKSEGDSSPPLAPKPAPTDRTP